MQERSLPPGKMLDKDRPPALVERRCSSCEPDTVTVPATATTPSLPAKRRLAILARTIGAVLRPPRAASHPPLRAGLLPPMAGRLEIARDARGIPHIYAAQEPDLYAALGYLQAADRFVLLDVTRHLGAGRLCDLVGSLRVPAGAALRGKGIRDLDAFIRPLGFEAQSERDFERVSERGRACLEAYARGINAGLRAMGGVYPPEYLLLGAVRPWRPADALLLARTCAFTIALGPLEVELNFDAIRGHLGDAAARRFFPEAPWENAPTSYAAIEGAEPEPPLHLPAGGSNNWVIGAARSQSGAPIVANDPHVPLFPLPTFWHHAHLECPRYRVQGGLMLGCPVFGFGHNSYLAWGVTTAYRDGWDLYRVHRVRGDATRYRTVAGTGVIARHHERRRVRFGREVHIEWESCEHGVIYPDWKHHDGTDLAVRVVPSDLASYFDGYLDLAASQTVAEHRSALARINEGPFDFNHVYGHKDGPIAWEPFGRLPRRQGDGLFVRDAQDPSAQWDGFVPFGDMPKIQNPERGFVNSANSIVDPDNYRIATTAIHVEPRHRHDRIAAFLAQRPTHSVESCMELQRDLGSDYGPPVRDALLRLLGTEPAATPVQQRAREVLAAWPGDFPCESAGAPLFAFTQQALARRVCDALLGPTIGARYLGSRRGVARTQRLLLDEEDPLRADLERLSGKSLARLAGEAFAAAVERVVARCGEDPARWQWGHFQKIRLGTLLGEVPGIGRLFRALEAPFPGDMYTVSPSVPIPMGGGLRPFVGASSRFICDLARPDEAWFAHSSGPSGDIASAYFANLTEPWRRFEYFRSALCPAGEVPDVVERVVIDPPRERR